VAATVKPPTFATDSERRRPKLWLPLPL
jgi:hypothetical protein